MSGAVQVGSYADFFAVLNLDNPGLDQLRPGRINRLRRRGKGGKDDAGFVILHTDGSLWGGNWATQVTAYFNPNGRKCLSRAEWAEIARRNREIHARERLETLRRQDRAAGLAQRIMAAASPYRPHPYMAAKHLKGKFPTLKVIRAEAFKRLAGFLPTAAEGARMEGELLIAPLYTAREGRPVLRNVQVIDAAGNKRFLPGGQKKGCFWCSRNGVRKMQGIIGIAEGIATALSVAVDVAKREGQIPVFAAMDAGNLAEVAMVIQRLFFNRDVVIFGDWDESGTGQAAAREAAAQTRCGRVQFPPIDEQVTRQFQRVTGSDKVPSDFNDFLVAIGRI